MCIINIGYLYLIMIHLGQITLVGRVPHCLDKQVKRLLQRNKEDHQYKNI
jgi:hypothetical protein